MLRTLLVVEPSNSVCLCAEHLRVLKLIEDYLDVVGLFSETAIPETRASVAGWSQGADALL